MHVRCMKCGYEQHSEGIIPTQEEIWKNKTFSKRQKANDYDRKTVDRHKKNFYWSTIHH
jgi:hypothetical protein